MAKTERTGLIEALDRLGLLKYVLATLLTGTAFVLAAGAYYWEWRQNRPPRLSAEARAVAERQAPKPALPTNALRAPANRLSLYAVAANATPAFAFYGITDQDTPQSLAEKFARSRIAIGRGPGPACNFAGPLADPAGTRDDRDPVAAYISALSRDCCAVAASLPGQLATYLCARRPDEPAKTGAVTGTAVFSEFGAGLLTLTLRFADRADGYAAAMARDLDKRLGPPSQTASGGLAWARNKGLVTLVRNGRTLLVAVYYGANIERHAALALRQASPPSRSPAAKDPRMAFASAW